MTIVEISKQKVIKAIKEEPFLVAGRWVQNDHIVGFIKEMKEEKCPVCAVGAVMRNILDPNAEIEDINIAAEEATETQTVRPLQSTELEYYLKVAKDYCDKKLYMNALSMYFETLWEIAEDRSTKLYGSDYLSRHQVYRIRQKLVQFVKDNFPSKIQIDIDGVKPAKDIKVVG